MLRSARQRQPHGHTFRHPSLASRFAARARGCAPSPSSACPWPCPRPPRFRSGRIKPDPQWRRTRPPPASNWASNSAAVWRVTSPASGFTRGRSTPARTPGGSGTRVEPCSGRRCSSTKPLPAGRRRPLPRRSPLRPTPLTLPPIGRRTGVTRSTRITSTARVSPTSRCVRWPVARTGRMASSARAAVVFPPTRFNRRITGWTFSSSPALAARTPTRPRSQTCNPPPAPWAS